MINAIPFTRSVDRSLSLATAFVTGQRIQKYLILCLNTEMWLKLNTDIPNMITESAEKRKQNQDTLVAELRGAGVHGIILKTAD